MANKSNSLIFRITLKTAALIAIIVMTFSAWQLWLQFMDAQRQLEARSDRILELMGASLRKPLWEMDFHRAQDLIEGMMSHESIVLGIEVASRGKVVARASRPGFNCSIFDGTAPSQLFIKQRSISIFHRQIGRISLCLSQGPIKKELWNSATKYIYSMVIVIITLIVSLIWLLRKEIFTPLQELGASASEIARGSLDKKISAKGNDEIGRLFQDLDKMRISLRDTISQLMSYQESLHDYSRTLETKVEERTAQLRENLDLLERARNDAEAATRAKSEFLANISHEIRTPLNAAIGMIELMLQSNLTQTQREQAKMVKSAADTLLALLNDILDFSRIEAGRLNLESIEFDIEATLGFIETILTPMAIEKGLQLSFQIHPSTPKFLKGDPNRLKQTLLNLGGNAIKFTESGYVKIFVELEKYVDQGVLLHFAVKDTGPGVAPENKRMIFERFSQADSSNTRKYGGAGLGLAISTQIVRAMGGEIWVESELDQGSVFHFTVLLGVVDWAYEDEENKHQETANIRPDCLRGLRVMLAEDNPLNQAVTNDILEKFGCKVTIAGNGREVLDNFNAQSFDLILMDVQMPEMDGYETTKAIRRIEMGSDKRTPIIAQTAYALSKDAQKSLDAGMDAHLTKPINPESLLKLLVKMGIRNGAADLSCLVENKSDNMDPETQFDYHDLLTRLGGDTGAVSEMASIFFESTRSRIDELLDHIENQRFEEAGRTAHTLKGACSTFAALNLKETAHEIQTELEYRDKEAILNLVENFKVGVDNLETRIENITREQAEVNTK